MNYKFITCEFCGYKKVAAAAGRYGCPNCLGEVLEPEQDHEARLEAAAIKNDNLTERL